jgi:magnesium-transporting ATPase (P-type)
VSPARTSTLRTAVRPGDGGLTSQEAAARLAADGPNVLPGPAQRRMLRALLGQLVHLLALLLWVAAGLALQAGMPALAIAIVTIVLLNGVFAFWQEYRADRSNQRLQALLPTGTRVIRDGRVVTVDAAELVVGDVVVLTAGDRVGADVEVLRCGTLTVDESMVTGESGAVAHEPGDRLMAGTFVVQGAADAVPGRPVRATRWRAAWSCSGSSVWRTRPGSTSARPSTPAAPPGSGWR